MVVAQWFDGAIPCSSRFAHACLATSEPVAYLASTRRIWEYDHTLHCCSLFYEFDMPIAGMWFCAGCLAVAFDDGRIVFLDVDTRKCVFGMYGAKGDKGPVTAGESFADQRFFYVRQGAKDVISVQGFRTKEGITSTRIAASKQAICTLAAHSKEPLLAVGYTDKTVRVFDCGRNEWLGVAFKEKNTGEVSAMQFMGNGRLLAVAYSDGQVLMFGMGDANATGAEIPLWEKQRVFKGNQPMLSLCHQEGLLIGLGQGGTLLSLAYSVVNGSKIASMSVNEHTLQDLSSSVALSRYVVCHRHFGFGVSNRGDLMTFAPLNRLVVAYPPVERIDEQFSNVPQFVYYILDDGLYRYDMVKGGTGVLMTRFSAGGLETTALRVSYDRRVAVVTFANGSHLALRLDELNGDSNRSARPGDERSRTVESEAVGSKRMAAYDPKGQKQFPLLQGLVLEETDSHLYGIDPESGQRFSICSIEFPGTRVCSLLGDRILFATLVQPADQVKFWYKSVGLLETVVRAFRFVVRPSMTKLLDDFDAQRVSDAFLFALIDHKEANLAWNIILNSHTTSWLRKFKVAVRCGFFDTALQTLEAEYLGADEASSDPSGIIPPSSTYYVHYRNLAVAARIKGDDSIAERCEAKLRKSNNASSTSSAMEATSPGGVSSQKITELKLRKSTKVAARSAEENMQIFDDTLSVGAYIFQWPSAAGTGEGDMEDGGGLQVMSFDAPAENGGSNDVGAAAVGASVPGGSFAAALAATRADVDEEDAAQKAAREAFHRDMQAAKSGADSSDEEDVDKPKRFVLKIKEGGSKDPGNGPSAGGLAPPGGRPRNLSLFKLSGPGSGAAATSSSASSAEAPPASDEANAPAPTTKPLGGLGGLSGPPPPAGRRRTQSMASPSPSSAASAAAASPFVSDVSHTDSNSQQAQVAANSASASSSVKPGDLYKQGVTELENGNFADCYRLCEECVRLLVQDPQQVDKRINIIMAVRYKLAAKLLAAVQKIPDDQVEEKARRSLVLATLDILPKHRFLCTKMAVMHQMQLENFGVAAKLIREIIDKMPEKPREFLQARLSECEGKGFADRNVGQSGDQLMETMCWRSLHWMEPPKYVCTYCRAHYSATGGAPIVNASTDSGKKCLYCHVAPLSGSDDSMSI